MERTKYNSYWIILTALKRKATLKDLKSIISKTKLNANLSLDKILIPSTSLERTIERVNDLQEKSYILSKPYYCHIITDAQFGLAKYDNKKIIFPYTQKQIKDSKILKP